MHCINEFRHGHRPITIAVENSEGPFHKKRLKRELFKVKNYRDLILLDDAHRALKPQNSVDFFHGKTRVCMYKNRVKNDPIFELFRVVALFFSNSNALCDDVMVVSSSTIK